MLTIDYDNLWELGWRLGEFIPIAVDQKQQMLDFDDPWERISAIEQLWQKWPENPESSRVLLKFLLVSVQSHDNDWHKLLAVAP